ncbi:MAG TPA: creatininase family protein [Gemmatimonadaceae bacterium]
MGSNLAAGPRPKRLKEMRPAEVAATLAADPRLIVPIGTCEQHGPHLPMGGDTLVIERLADDLSAEFQVLRAPTVEYGVNVATDRTFAGNATVRRKTLHRLLNDLVDSWESGGVREFILITAHDGDAHLEALESVITSTARVRAVNVFGLDFHDLLQGQVEPIHGDEVDTSLLLYVAPHLVQMSLAQDYMLSDDALRRYRRGWLRVPADSPGSIGRPSLASPEKGRLIYERIRGRVADRIFRTAAPAF